MPTAVASNVDWMRAAAIRLGDALGWPVSWSDSSALPGDGSHVEVRDDAEIIGRLTVEWPDDPRLAAGFESAREVTEVFAEALSRLAVASRTMNSQRQDVSTLVEMNQTVSRTGDLPSALAHLLSAAARLSGMWSAAFFLLDPRTNQLRLRATHQLPAKSVPAPQRSVHVRTPDGLAWQRGSVLLDRHVPSDSGWLPAGTAVGIGVPIFVDSTLIGSLWCYDRRQRSVGTWETQTLKSVAVQIASVLERTMLLKESAERKQLKTDLRIASNQLPVGLLQHPPAEWGLDIAVRAATVTEVGGDLCDVIPLGEHRTLIAIGDAVGHSVPAAMLVSVARGALRALVSHSPPESLTTQALMIGVNRALSAVTRAEQFVTLTLGIVDSRAATLTYTNAGHPPPLLLRDGVWLSLASHGLFLGVTPEVQYSSTELALADDDVLICFTDGVTETINASREVFRRQGIKSTIADGCGATAEAMAELIWRGLESHDPGRPLRDDRTLLVLKYAAGA